MVQKAALIKCTLYKASYILNKDHRYVATRLNSYNIIQLDCIADLVIEESVKYGHWSIINFSNSRTNKIEIHTIIHEKLKKTLEPAQKKKNFMTHIKNS